jgi:Ser/Thr protein kinase RdoA (MazF antagonist)
MPDSVPSDHPSVTTYRAEVARSGGTRRPCVRPRDPVDALDDGDLIRLDLDGTTYHARVVVDATGLVLRGAYDNRRLARNPGEAENRLAAWIADAGRDFGSAVDLDEIDPGYHYGLRVPGDRAVYRTTSKPKDSLASIAERVERDRDDDGFD